MYIPKRYGESKIEKCPFCGLSAWQRNSQGVPVCKAHAGRKLEDMKCACGETLELRTGKWGPFFTCISCGIVNMRKALEVNDVRDKSSGGISKEQARREEIVRPDDPRYF